MANLNVREFLDNRAVGPFQWKILLICLTILILDGFDIVAMGFIAPAIVDDWGITREALGPVLSAGLFGLAIGALCGGPLADRYGRRSIIIGSVFFFGVMSLASAWAPNLTALTILRFLTGLGLGASQPNAATLISEYAPKHRRALFVTVVYCGFTVGAALGGFLATDLIASYGWHSILVVGGVVPMVFALVLIPILPESARFLALRSERKRDLIAIVNTIAPNAANETSEFIVDDKVDKKGSSIKLLGSKAHRNVTALLWIGMFMNMLTVYLLNSWLPIMIKDQGFSLSDAAFIGAMMQVGGTLGNILLGWEMDRWNPHRVMCVTLIGAAIVALLIGTHAQSVNALMILILILGFFTNSANTGWVALAASHYPTEMRATGTSWMTGVSRFGAIFGASIGAMLLGAHWTFGQVFMFLSLPIFISIVAAYLKGRLSGGTPLQADGKIVNA
jgi:AAHS family 4-hydroxybenzoate transporter-like MFS transporter